MQKRQFFKILTLAFLCASLLLLVSWLPLAADAPLASAHSFVIGSDPIDSSTINKPPALVRIYFDAPIAPASQAIVYAFVPGSSNGLVVSANHGTINATNPKELDIALLPSNKLPQGGYEVKWTALSLTDGHTSSGLIGFNLGFSNTGVSGTPTLGPISSNHFPQLTMQGALSIAWDWLVTLALLFWAGILVTEMFIMPRVLPENFLVQMHKHSRSLQALCLAGLLVGEVINLILRATTLTQTSDASGISLNALAQLTLNTNYGHLWLARVALLVVALLFFWWGRDHRSSRSSSLSNATSASKSSQRFSRLRQQARPDSTAENSATPMPARSQARVSGAVDTNVPARAITGTQAHVPSQNLPDETPTHQPALWLSAGGLVLAGLIMLTQVLSNELLQLAPLPISTGLFSGLSLASQAIWFGCLAYLGFTLLPLQPTANADKYADMLIRILKRARPFLLAASGVLLISELFLNEVTIQAPVQFFDTPYGCALLVRDVLLVLMLIVTGSMLFVLLPRLQRQAVLLPVVTAEMPARRTRTFKLEQTEHTIKRTLHVLSGLAAITLICVALMNFFAPPVVLPNLNYAALVQQSAASSTPVTQTQNVDGLTIALNVSPARVGATNTISLAINDAQGKALSNATVKLAINMQIMDMGTTRATINPGNTTYTTTFNAGQTFIMAGLWVIQAEIDQPGQKAVIATFRVMAE